VILHGNISEKVNNMEQLLNQLTLAQAQAYNNSSEQFTFCTDILDANNLIRCDKNVLALENKFLEILRG